MEGEPRSRGRGFVTAGAIDVRSHELKDRFYRPDGAQEFATIAEPPALTDGAMTLTPLQGLNTY